MFFPRRVVVSLGVFSLVVVAMVAMSRRPEPPPRPALPKGKVEPYLWTDLLLAPDGTLWSLDHPGSVSPTSLILKPRAPGNDWKQVSGVAGRGVGVKEDGTLWLWRPAGGSVFGGGVSDPPVQIGLERDWAHASHSWNYAPLLKTDGSLWYLGDEVFDPHQGPMQLTSASRPSRLGTDNDWAKVTNSDGVYYAMKKDGSLWHWGRMTRGGPFEPMPLPLSSDRDWSTFSRCSHGLAALKRDGSLWMTGAGVRKVVPDFASGPAAGLIPIGSERHWVAVTGGEDNLLARHKDGSWWVSGLNGSSQLGVRPRGGATNLGRPTHIPINLDLWAWSAAGETTLILTRDGSFYYMGMTPGNRPSLSGVAALKAQINRQFRQFGMAQPFGAPEMPRSHRPVKIGELPASVQSALESGQ